ncbi:EAL domain-containing protein [Aromatoleum toluvorans]|uniref:EAL domain-containing protein n=1 Tax=Aromatoleum toluvorans TaxID=92002 RepID=A0ABX1Q5C7_9RHOO|nr:EAL domain-containing protein [Aromatoleum toluvorans]NMG45971.1 EAL domain-containing protein [Aromatoleum toluvorans]
MVKLSLRLSSIRMRLLLASTVVQIVLLTLLLANSVRLMNQATSASLNTLVSQNATMLHAMAVAYGDMGELHTLQDVLGELLSESDEGLVYVRIVAPDGQVLVSAGLPDMRELPEADDAHARGGAGGGVVHVRRPLLLDRNEVGFLQFGVSVSVLAAARKAITEQGTAIALAELLMTFGLLSGIGYLLTRNLSRLLAGSEAIAAGKLDHRLPESGHDELARLARRFNVMAANLQDRIGELQDSAERLKASEQRYELAIQGAHDGLWDWDIADGQVYCSPRYCEVAGLTAGRMYYSPAEVVTGIHPDDAPGYRTKMIEHLKGFSTQFKCEYRARQQDGSYRWVMTRGVAVRGEDGRAARMAGSISDVHEHKLVQMRLQYDALHDGLTQLPNRALFLEHACSALGQQRRTGGQDFAVLAINLQRFRLVNDSFGHEAGDALLCHVARTIQETLRYGDIAARVGGDQFALLLNRIENPAEALRLAGTLRERLAKPTSIAGQILYPKFRIGMSLSIDYRDSENGDTMLRDADNALQRTRERGDDSVAIFHASMHEQALQSLQLEGDLRDALGSDELIVHFQPIVALDSGSITSFEALVRWRHPVRGMLPPNLFVPLAETLGLIHELDMLVLRRACERLAQWRQLAASDAAVPRVSVNLSATQFARPDLAGEIIAEVDRHGLPREMLRFEVTESVLAQPEGPAAEILQKLRTAGMSVLIDDFGTGYSALSYLHTIPCDLVKLDGSFVRSLENDERLRTIVARSIELAHDLGMRVVAECIETTRQSELLLGMGCDYGQGYLFARPLDVEAVEELLFGKQLAREARA